MSLIQKAADFIWKDAAGLIRARLNKRGFFTGPDYVTLQEDWLKKPGINADIADPTAISTYTIANENFEVLGTNATTATVAFRAKGGITLTTTTSANDQVIIAPHLDTNQTAWAVASWLSQLSPRYEAWVQTGASVAAMVFWAGLKLTNTPTIATDADQAYFKFTTTADTNGSATKLTFVSTRSNVADVVDILDITIAASTLYRLVIEIDTDLKPHIFVNGVDLTSQLSASGAAALTTAISFKPYVGVQTLTTAAKVLSVLPGYKISCLAA